MLFVLLGDRMTSVAAPTARRMLWVGIAGCCVTRLNCYEAELSPRRLHLIRKCSDLVSRRRRPLLQVLKLNLLLSSCVQNLCSRLTISTKIAKIFRGCISDLYIIIDFLSNIQSTSFQIPPNWSFIIPFRRYIV